MVKKVSKLKAGASKALGEDAVAVNFSGIQAGQRRNPRIAEGNYRAKVAEVTQKPTKAGDPMVVWIFEIVDHPKYSGQQFYYNSVLTEKALWNFRATLEALKVKVKDETMNIPLPKLVGRTAGIQLVDDEYEGKLKSAINDVFNEDLLEEEDEVEELEDEEEDEWEDEEDDDEEDEEEEALSQKQVEGLGIKELRAYAREQGVYETGMKKADMLSALFEDEDEEDDDWDDEEIDLDDDEL